MKITKVVRWYDRYTRSHVVQRLNSAGDQVGDADYVGSRGEADKLVSQYKREHNLQEGFKEFVSDPENHKQIVSLAVQGLANFAAGGRSDPTADEVIHHTVHHIATKMNVSLHHAKQMLRQSLRKQK